MRPQSEESCLETSPPLENVPMVSLMGIQDVTDKRTEEEQKEAYNELEEVLMNTEE